MALLNYSPVRQPKHGTFMPSSEIPNDVSIDGLGQP
jgi:hypothetical protein